ncbi:MAG TPA: hypothetical protein PLD82_06695 [Spirochaetota bacterium]|nr:hypothetical protein [Spirochaetota bacterium]HPH02985.1 hypothetical protein [Spirochaetota bacterium]
MNPDSPTGDEVRLREVLQRLVRTASGLDQTLSLDKAHPGTSCGDRLQIRCDADRNGLAIAWNGEGCSLMQAGAALLVEVLSGKEPHAARLIVDGALAMASGETASPVEGLGDEPALVLGAFSTRPNRRECLLFAWRAMRDWFDSNPEETSGAG